MRRRFVLMASVLAACTSGETPESIPVGEDGGTLVIALPATPATLMPPSATRAQEKQIIDQIFDVLAEIGPQLNTIGDDGFTPRLASGWTWSTDSLSIAFAIDPRARWHDGQPVRAQDVRFSFELYTDSVTASRLAAPLSIVDSVSARDSVTAVVWFSRRSPEQFYRFTSNLTVLPQHLLQDVDRANLASVPFATRPVGSGPFRFANWESRQVLEATANEEYHLGRPKLNRILWQLNPDVNTALTAVLTGQADLFETITPDGMARLVGNEHAHAVAFSSNTYTYLGFNQTSASDYGRPHPIFTDRALRMAIAAAINREAMLANVFDSLAYLGTGPFSRSVPTADLSLPAIPFDSAGAGRMLDSLGWIRGDGGIRRRNGQPLAFSLLVPASSSPRVRYAELIQAQLRSHGVTVAIDVVDQTSYAPRVTSGHFDAVLHTWTVDPSPGAIRGTWGSRPAAERGFNLQAWSNPAFDAALDSAEAEADPATSKALYQRAYRILNDDRVAIWLYESRSFIPMHKRIRVVGNASDYWWRYVRHWWIPANERITRDR